MSYILDALKRAESERERGVVPGLHSQTVPLRRPVARSGSVARPVLLAGVALVVALLIALAWRALGPLITGASPQGVAISLIPGEPFVVGSPAVPTPTVPTPASAASASLPAPAPLSNAIPATQATKPAIQITQPKPGPRQQTKPAPVAPVVAAAEPVTPRIMPIGELPAEVRQTLPKVVISGSTYSDNQALRMLIINGEVFREGEKPAPGLQLEQIRAKAAVLNFKGVRYSVGY